MMKNSLLSRHICMAILFVFFFTLTPVRTYGLSPIEMSNEQKLWDCMVFISQGKTEQALPILERLYRGSKNSKTRQLSAVTLARIWKERKEYDKALSYLKEYIDIDQYQEYPLLEDYPFLEAGLIYKEKKEYSQALKYFDYLGRNKALGMKTVLAAEGCGDTFLLLGNYKKSIDYYDYGLKQMDALQLSLLSNRDKICQEGMKKKKE